MKNKYGISSEDYLARAKSCISKKSPSFLFYAAFEVRCGVEARMEEYLEAQEHISKKKRQGWRVADLAKNIDAAFQYGQRDAVILVRDPSSKAVLLELRYTPVTKSLQKKAQKLGNYLHSAKHFHSADSSFWGNLRKELNAAIIELEHATTGNLLAPPLRRPDGTIEMNIQGPSRTAINRTVRVLFEGAQKILDVRYE